MKKTTRKALLGTLVAGLLALATTPVTVHASQARFIADWVRSGLDIVGSVNGWLDEDEENIHEYWLQRGVQYAFAGTCDDDCIDLDLKLLSRGGTLQAEDTGSNARPRIVFTPPATGTYRLRVVMFRCTIEPCRYDVDEYKR